MPNSALRGKARCASWLPAMTANHTPSSTWSSAAAAACRTAAMFAPFIEPEVSTMTTSAASPDPDCPASPASEQLTVTMAWTSVPPSGRNSFW